MTKIRPIMFVGTGSDVGKSIINAAFCRIFKQDGYSPAPFKAQNMSLNSYATPDGFEIGRAQAVQAEACKLECVVDMNPILLKPTSNMGSQVVLNGKPIGTKSAQEYFLGTDRDMLFAEAMKAYSKLEERFNPVVIEGAGSISELNLWDKDITNMRIAVASKAATFLIADIDRGGVFGSVYGTLKLLPPEHIDLIEGIIINKFRGDISMFEAGKKILEDLTNKPVVGIVPYFNSIYIEQEDSVGIDTKLRTFLPGKINIAVVHLPHMSNFTDFDNLERIPEVHLYYSAELVQLEQADVLIIPGSKNTIGDLQFLKDKGLFEVIQQMHKRGKQVYGICGGFQMMGDFISDPDGVEGDVKGMSGLGILPVSTTLGLSKETCQTKFRFLDTKEECLGYEIHMGTTESQKPSPLCFMGDKTDGYYLNKRTWGTYMHGVFDNPVVIEHILHQLNKDINVDFNYAAFKDKEFDKLADFVRSSVDMAYIYKTLHTPKI